MGTKVGTTFDPGLCLAEATRSMDPLRPSPSDLDHLRFFRVGLEGFSVFLTSPYKTAAGLLFVASERSSEATEGEGAIPNDPRLPPEENDDRLPDDRLPARFSRCLLLTILLSNFACPT